MVTTLACDSVAGDKGNRIITACLLAMLDLLEVGPYCRGCMSVWVQRFGNATQPFPGAERQSYVLVTGKHVC